MHSPRSSAPRALWSTIALLGGALLGTSAGAATFSVTNTNDAGAGSLRQAIADANASVDLSDTITFDPATFGTTPQTILLNGSELAIGKNLIIQGTSPDLLTVSGSNASRVFEITAGTTDISGLTFTAGNGSGGDGGGGLVDSGAVLSLTTCNVSGNSTNGPNGGGGLANLGTLSLTDCTVFGNSSLNEGGGVYSSGSDLSLTRCTISGNTGDTFSGGVGIALGPATITNCTVADNSSPAGSGGGFDIYTPDPVSIVSCTISRNSAAGPGGILLENSTFLTMQGTIVAGNTTSSTSISVNPDFSSAGTFTDGDLNLVGDNTGGPTFTGSHDQIGTAASPVDPGLDPAGLQNNGGPTLTVALLSSSSAVDADFSAAPPATDQRGVARPVGVRADIGAFEFVPDTTPPVTTPALTGPSFANGFWRGPVTVTLTATDAQSGVAGTFYRIDSGPQQTYSGPFTVTGDFDHLVTFYSVDNVGNAEGPAKAVTFSIDSTAPVTTITSRAVATGREVTLKNTDNFSGPGGTFYRVDSGPQQTYTGPFIVTGNFQHLVTAYSIDRALNAEAAPASLTFTVDTSGPTTTPALSGPSFANGFYRGPVTVTLNATDKGSSIAGTFYRVDSGPQQTYFGPFTVSGDFDHLVTFYSVDSVGLAESPAKSVTFKIDSTAPVTTITSRAVTGGQEVTLKNTDNFSGPGGTFYRVDSGPEQAYSGPFLVTGNFQHLVTAYSIDRALNAEAAPASLTFTVSP